MDALPIHIRADVLEKVLTAAFLSMINKIPAGEIKEFANICFADMTNRLRQACGILRNHPLADKTSEYVKTSLVVSTIVYDEQGEPFVSIYHDE